uniref:Cadherin domain-containing protein n=1 Tax=Rodentolepis nana TaxID=102285 RepID=A0A0R3TRQ3_RODNA
LCDDNPLSRQLKAGLILSALTCTFKWITNMPNPSVLQGILLLFALCFVSLTRADMLPAIASFSMAEESPVPLILGNVLANLQARAYFHEDISDILIFPSAQPFFEYFQLIQKRQSNQKLVSSELQLIKSFDLETVCKKRLSMQQCSQANYGCCCDSHNLFCSIKLQLAVRFEGGIFHTAAQQTPLKVFLIEIKIFDENDQTPVFTPDTFTLKVSEGVKYNENYRLPLAKDGDLGQNSEVFYSLAFIHGRAPSSKRWVSIPKENGLFSFSTSSQSLSLSINGDLDREEIEMYKIIIEAKDGVINPSLQKTGTLTVSVMVTDVNDVSPMFKSRNLEVSVQENSANGTVICTIMAQDYDSGSNGQIEYSIPPSYRESPFKIDPKSGSLTVSGEIDREKIDAYKIIVQANDKGSPAKTSTLPVYIKVLDVNDNPPDISINSIFMDSEYTHSNPILKISEGVPLGTSIANVSVSDRDVSENSTISCHVLNEGHELRLTSSSTYSLYLTKELDYEAEKRLKVILSCTDFGDPFSLNSEAVIEIIVLNENDNPPVFQEPLIIPPAWIVNNSEIAKFSAILREGDNGKSGEESLKGCVVFLPKSFPLGDAFLRFKAKDADFERESAENEGGVLFSMSMRSEQRFQTESGPFPIVYPRKATLLSLSEKTGEVMLTSSLDFDGTICVLEAEIMVHDGKFSSSKKLTFIIGESNHYAPIVRIFNFALANSLSPHQIFDQEHNGSLNQVPFYIPRQSKSHSVIGQAVGSDTDPGLAGRLTYNLSIPQSRCMDLSINSSTGLLTLLEVHKNFSTDCHLQATLNVTDNGFPKRYTCLLITFHLFDANQLSPTIRINQSIIPSQQNANNETEWYFNATVPRGDDALFQLATLNIPGLIECTFQAKFCASSADNISSLQGVSLDENLGHVYIADSFVANPNITFYILVSNTFWPSLPTKTFKADMTSSKNETIDVRVTEVDGIDCQVQYVVSVEPSYFRRNFIIFCISIFAIVAIICLLIIILVILLRNSRRKLTIAPLLSMFKKKEAPSFYAKAHFQSNSVEVNDPVKFNEEYNTCLQTKIPAYEIATNDVSVSQVLLKAPKYPTATSSIRIGGGRVSTIALKQHPSMHPTVSDISNTYYVMENIHQNDLNSKLYSSKESTPVHSHRSPSSGRSIKSETSPLPGHANVNIIVHNDFEKSATMHHRNMLSSDDKPAKVGHYLKNLIEDLLKLFLILLLQIFRIAPNLPPIESTRNTFRIELDPSTMCFIKEKTPCD